MARGDDLMTEAETADLLHISLRTLRRWRQKGTGPGYLRAGRRVLYERAEVLAWARRQAEGPDR